MRGFINLMRSAGYQGFKPMNAAGEIEYPEPKTARYNLFKASDGLFRFLDASPESILWFAIFYTEESAIKVHDYLAKGGLLDAKV